MESRKHIIFDSADSNTKEPYLLISTNDIRPGLRLKLCLKGCKLFCNNSEINNKAIISFFDNSIEINGTREDHDGKITFIKKKFDDKGNIKYVQLFKIIIINKIPSIICLTAPPDTPTSFLITEKEFILERDHIILFGDYKNDRIFMVEDFTELNIKFQQVSFKNVKNGPKLQKKFEFNRMALKKKNVLGDFEPLESPDFEKFKIILGFDTLLDKWYLIREAQNQNNEEDNKAYVWIFKFENLVKKLAESSPVELKEKLVINSGDCELEVMKIME